MKKVIASILLFLEIAMIGSTPIGAVNTDGFSSPWTREKAAHLAGAVLIYTSETQIDALYNAGSAANAVNLLFPSASGPDRTEFDTFMTNYTSSGFNWGDGNHAIRYYQLMYALDPYEAKRKLFSLFEDIFAVNIDSGRNIGYKDINDQHTLIYENMFGSYQTLVKKILMNNGQPGDYAEGAFLDLFNQEKPNNPNENYARELLQLFLMGEYKPGEGKENNDTRNYEESDVKSLARILTGLKSDAMTHVITFDANTHYTGTTLTFLSGTLTGGESFPFYDTNSGTVNPVMMRQSNNGNNGLTDNAIEYIFAKRSREIALFLADRLYRFYIDDTPTRASLDTIAGIIESNNFDIFTSVKQTLILDMMYSDKSMNQIRYKNPLELGIGTIKHLRGNILSEMTQDQNIYDTNLLRRIGWTPYFPGSVFGRDGFDNSLKWSSTSNQNAWMTATNYFTYRSSGTGVIDFRNFLGIYRKDVTTEIIPIITSTGNTYSGSLTIIGGTIDTNISLQGASVAAFATVENIDVGTGAVQSDAGTTDTGAVFDNIGINQTEVVLENTGGIAETDAGSGSATGTGDTSAGAINEVITSTGILENTGITFPEEAILTESGATVVGTSGVDTETGTTSTGEVVTEEIVLNAAPEVIGTGSVVALNSGSVVLPRFLINTDYGSITIYSGSYNGNTKVLTISSGSLADSGNITPIYSGNIIFSPTSTLTADIISSDTILDIYENYIIGNKNLGSDARIIIKEFLETDGSGVTIPISPSNGEYYNRNLRGLLSILLSSPEYVLLRGSDLPPVIDTNEQRFLDTVTGKLFFIELYGGNDYLTSIIPKDEYSTYLDYRTNQSGSIAITGTGLIDIGNFYMNSALAYGSGGGVGFKSLYDQGYLKIFNRVGAYKHSQDHDAAAKQISSYSNTTDSFAEGLFGHLVNREFESSHTISLGAKLPNIYRGGHYINMGGTVILSNPVMSSQTYHMTIMSQLARTRSFPSNTRSLFQDAGRISDIAKISLAQGGPGGANGDMNNIFRFSKILMANNIGRAYYMGGYGGYDTHGDQFTGLNRNLQFVNEAVTKFFNEVKDTQDVTIVIFSEFGRTNKVNGSLGTDHGDGGGMFVITSNQNLRNILQNGTYGNMSIKNAKSNSLGVGVDYRSVYGKIFESLYGLNGSTFFGDTVSLDDDISLDQNEISLLSYSYQASGRNITMNGELTVRGRNYNTGKAGYTRLLTGTGVNTLKSTNIRETKTGTGIYAYTFQIGSSSQPYFNIDSFSNQFAQTTIIGSITGSSAPGILSNTERKISQTGSSILPLFQGTIAPRVLAGSGLILNDSLTGSLISIPGSNTEIFFSSGLTNATEVSSSSGSLTWNGGFILGELQNRDYFIPREARIISDGRVVERANVARLLKLGADKLGVGMKLNQSFVLKFLSVPTSDSYRVISSEDGINWSDVESPGKEYTRDQSGTISITVDHLSYFALFSNTATLPPPSCTLTINPGNIYNGSGATMGWNIQNTATGIINPGNIPVSATGALAINPPVNATTSYILNVSNASGNASCSAQITSSAQIIITPPPGGGGGGTSTAGPGGPGGTPTRTLDICPDGDLSGNQYDGSCEPGIIVANSGNTLPYTPPLMDTVTITEKTLYSLGRLDDLVQDNSESGKRKLDTQIEQEIYTIALEIWRESLNQDVSLGELDTYIRDEKRVANELIAQRIYDKTLAILYKFAQKGEAIPITQIEEEQEDDTQVESTETESEAITGEYLYVNAERSLTFRKKPYVSPSTVFSYLKRNTQVQVIEQVGDWIKVLYDGMEGFVKGSFLRGENTGDIIRQGGTVEGYDAIGVVNVEVSGFVRREPSLISKIKAVLHRGDEVIILDELPFWYEIRLGDGTLGYIGKRLITR